MSIVVVGLKRQWSKCREDTHQSWEDRTHLLWLRRTLEEYFFTLTSFSQWLRVLLKLNSIRFEMIQRLESSSLPRGRLT
ncbi:F12M16.5 [Arabidopsis thaliana]|uniref:F12M16.5 n=1 Tax=Arabidopsis thaliana TaxID=3702 RepID=Q9MAI6_ARATH|nr:F12M16.5 [Arabidopsis thaliana]